MDTQEGNQKDFNPNPRMVALWRTLIDMERTWKSFSPLPDLNKSLFGVMMCIAHGGRVGVVPPGLREADHAQCKRRAREHDCAHDLLGHTLPEKPIAVGTIAAQLHQSLPAISQKISALEELGYVSRLIDPTDRRVTCVTLTDTGTHKLRQGRATFEAKLNAALDAMGEPRMEQLLTLLDELNETLKQTVAPAERTASKKQNKATKGE